MAVLSQTIGIRPSIFIASSSEGLEVAQAVKSYFDHEADVEIWNDNVFKLNKSNLANLLNLASFYDFSIMIFSPDDEVKSRKVKYAAPRDNVVFELGLFLGRLGPNRAFIIREKSVKTLSDYAGITIPTYTKLDDRTVDVSDACEEVRKIIKDQESLYEVTLLPSTALAVGYYSNFVEKVVDALLEGKDLTLENRDTGEHTKILYADLHWQIRILLPSKLANLQPLTLKSKTRRFTQVFLKTSYRSFPFYLASESLDATEKGVLSLFDIPTTLLASQKAIQQVFDRDFLIHGNRLLQVEQREISNFEKTLRLLIPDDLEDIRITLENLDQFNL